MCGNCGVGKKEKIKLGIKKGLAEPQLKERALSKTEAAVKRGIKKAAQ